MKTSKFLSIALMLVMFVTASAQDHITIYRDCDYRGSSQTLYEGTFNANDLGIGNDKLSSIRIPNGFTVTVYTDNYQRGKSETFEESVSCLPADLNDKVSSIRVKRSYNNNYGSGYNSEMVTLYKDANFRGAHKSLSAGYHNFTDFSFGNDELTSIRIPDGWSVTIYSDANYKGRSETYTRDVRELNALWNDRVSSIFITKTGVNASRYDKDKRDDSYESRNSSDMVTLYRDAYFKGLSRSLGEGYHNYNDLGIGNDQLSSIRVPEGWRITIYSERDYKGRVATFTGNVNELNSSWNDQVSSVYIARTGSNKSKSKKKGY